jgi:nitrilase
MHEPLPEGAEGVVYADIDLGMISLAKAAADPAGHYSRPDVTRLWLNKTPGDRVVSPMEASKIDESVAVNGREGAARPADGRGASLPDDFHGTIRVN